MEIALTGSNNGEGGSPGWLDREGLFEVILSQVLKEGASLGRSMDNMFQAVGTCWVCYKEQVQKCSSLFGRDLNVFIGCGVLFILSCPESKMLTL